MNELQKQNHFLPVSTVEPGIQIGMAPISQLHRCRNLLVENISKALSNRLNKIDKTLCDLSNNTGSKDLSQNKINLDELRIIRLKRNVIESTFKQQLVFETQKAINIIANTDSQSGVAAINKTEFKEINIDRLLLIESEKRLVEVSQHELIIMNQRLENLLHLNRLPLDKNPLSPSIICTAFYNVCEQLETGTKTKLLLIKILDNTLTSILKIAYENINRLLEHLIKQNEIISLENHVNNLAGNLSKPAGTAAPNISEINNKIPLPVDACRDDEKSKDNELYYNGHLDSKNEINFRIEKNTLPDFMSIFLTDNWNRVLQSICISDGKASKAWETAINTIDDLIWSISPKRTAAERETLINLIPELTMQLNTGMELINLNHESLRIFFDQLSEQHASAINCSFGSSDNEDDSVSEDNQEYTLSRADIDNTSYMTKTIMRLIDQGMLDIEEIVIEDKTEINYGNENYIEIARNLKKGDWLEFKDKDDASSKLRLAWINSVTGMRMFTNNTGVLVFEKTLQELAVNLRSGQLKIANNVSIVDKAMGSFMGNIKMIENG